jgi:hypothetical protein
MNQVYLDSARLMPRVRPLVLVDDVYNHPKVTPIYQLKFPPLG